MIRFQISYFIDGKKKRSRNSERSIVNYNTINGKFKSRKKFRDPALKKNLHETEEK